MTSIERVQQRLEPILSDLGYELLELRFLSEQGRRILRLTIDREGGVRVGDCERVSREIDTLLEVEADLGGRYALEVSSPGLDRPLVKEADFVRFTGRTVAVTTKEPIEGRRHYKGILQGVEQSLVVMEIDRQTYRVPLAMIDKAHLVYNGSK